MYAASARSHCFSVGACPWVDVIFTLKESADACATVTLHTHKRGTLLEHMVPRGLEPRTLRLLAVRSNQLSYETRCVCHCGMLAVFIVQVFRALGSAIAIAAVRARNSHDTLILRRALWPNG